MGCAAAMTIVSMQDLADATGLKLVGDGAAPVGRPAPPDQAGDGDLAIALSEEYADAMTASSARVAVLWQGADPAAFDLQAALIAERPRVALAAVTRSLDDANARAPGINPSAIVDRTAVIGKGAAIGPLVVIGSGARIGDGAIIASHVSIGNDAQIGKNALLHSGARIGAQCRIGDDFIAQPNAVIGADGFSFEPPQRGSVEAVRATGEVSAQNSSGFLRIHSLAPVEIGDDVEIGAGTTIDRGTLSPTRIGSGTKIDNQVQIAHNVQIGQMCLICAQVGIAGSTTVGDRVVLGGRVGVADHVDIGSDVVCAAATMVASNIRPRSVMMGMPATDRERAIREIMAVKRLPRVLAQMEEIRKKLGL